jgi:hypothetical protein
MESSVNAGEQFENPGIALSTCSRSDNTSTGPVPPRATKVDMYCREADAYA